jgi:hypothetical protein
LQATGGPFAASIGWQRIYGNAAARAKWQRIRLSPTESRRRDLWRTKVEEQQMRLKAAIVFSLLLLPLWPLQIATALGAGLLDRVANRLPDIADQDNGGNLLQRPSSAFRPALCCWA